MSSTNLLVGVVNNQTKLSYFICISAFVVQFGILFQGYLHPEQTNIRVSEKDMSEFPLVFKICFSPGLNESAIKEAGYEYSWKYFWGQSKYNSSILGWAGHTDTAGVIGTVEELVEKVTLHPNAEDVIDSILIDTMTKQHIPINLTSVKVWRMNFPYNCFTLDLTNHPEVEQAGLSMVAFNFPVVKNTSVSILPEGKNLACNREINFHKFFSAGADVKLIDLGDFFFIYCLTDYFHL